MGRTKRTARVGEAGIFKDYATFESTKASMLDSCGLNIVNCAPGRRSAAGESEVSSRQIVKFGGIEQAPQGTRFSFVAYNSSPVVAGSTFLSVEPTSTQGSFYVSTESAITTSDQFLINGRVAFNSTGSVSFRKPSSGGTSEVAYIELVKTSTPGLPVHLYVCDQSSLAYIGTSSVVKPSTVS